MRQKSTVIKEGSASGGPSGVGASGIAGRACGRSARQAGTVPAMATAGTPSNQ